MGRTPLSSPSFVSIPAQSTGSIGMGGSSRLSRPVPGTGHLPRWSADRPEPQYRSITCTSPSVCVVRYTRIVIFITPRLLFRECERAGAVGFGEMGRECGLVEGSEVGLIGKDA